MAYELLSKVENVISGAPNKRGRGKGQGLELFWKKNKPRTLIRDPRVHLPKESFTENCIFFVH